MRLRLSLALAIVFVVALFAAPSAYSAAIFDDFSSDSGLWTYSGLRQVGSNLVFDYAAHLHPGGYMELTNGQSQVGKAVFNWGAAPPFTVSFDFKQTPNPPGLDGGGMTFMFSKDTNYTRAMAGALGFMPDFPPGSIATGFGIEIDPYINPWDPPVPHIALIKDTTYNHLVFVPGLPALLDTNWHHLDVDVKTDGVDIRLDGAPILAWSGPTLTGFTGLGFSSATWWDDNSRQVDNFMLVTPPPQPVRPYLVWGSGQVTGPGNGAPSAYMPGVVVGQRSVLEGDVGSLGDVNLNNGSVDGELDTASQKSGSGTASGAITQNIPLPYPPGFPPDFPATTPFPGIINPVQALGNGGSFLFSPWDGSTGSYATVAGGANCQLYFLDPAGGTYFLNRLTLANGGDIWIDATNPVKIVVNEYLRVGSNTDVHVIGPEANVYWECQWAGTSAIRYAFDSNGGNWVGNVFCPDGGINYGNGSESGRSTAICGADGTVSSVDRGSRQSTSRQVPRDRSPMAGMAGRDS